MDIALLRTFAGVARAGSFAAHAREVGVDPSSISRQVAQLEAALGLTLFERTTRRLSLTEAGRLYLEAIRGPLDALEEAADVARDAVSVPSGVLRVTASVAFGERWLIPRLAAFRADYPEVQLELHLTDGIVDLSDGSVDVALRLGPRIEGALVAAKLFDTRYRVVASPDYLARAGHPHTPEELHKHDGLLFSLPGFREIWRLRPRAGGPVIETLPRPAMTISNALALRRAMQGGIGVALLADWTVSDDLANGSLIDLFPQHDASAGEFDSAAWVVYPSRGYMTARLRVFIDHLRTVANAKPERR
ncbi:LysR family transcriptional regulator [Pseudaestuariivita sp.]|uniref:LysR family transcriptional regulator n=1 Tax=Pseudaestuariivita sp. TaxID=2211669 RepID=UPI0040594F96